MYGSTNNKRDNASIHTFKHKNSKDEISRSHSNNKNAHPYVQLSDTAAASLTSEADQKRAYELISDVTILLKGECEHKAIKSPNVNSNAYYSVRFASITQNTINLSVITRPVMNNPIAFRNVHVKWPRVGSDKKGMSLQFQVFKSWVTRYADGQPMANHANFSIRPSGLDLPKYKFQQYRTVTCADTIQVTVKDKTEAQVLNDIIYHVYNMDKYIPQLQVSITMTDKTHAFNIKFGNMERVTYDFLEYLTEKFQQIANVQFICKGIDIRYMIIIVSFNERTTKIQFNKRFIGPSLDPSDNTYKGDLDEMTPEKKRRTE